MKTEDTLSGWALVIPTSDAISQPISSALWKECRCSTCCHWSFSLEDIPQSSWVTAVKLLLETFPIRSAFPLESLEDEGYRSREGKEWMRACVSAKSLQSCLTLCDFKNCSPPGSSVCGISQARILEWVAISSSRGSTQPSNQTPVSFTGRGILYHSVTGVSFSPETIKSFKNTAESLGIY